MTYDEISNDNNLEYTIIARQGNGKLVEAEELDLRGAHPGHLTMEELMEFAESSASAGFITSMCIAAVLVGVLKIVKNCKRTAEPVGTHRNQKEDILMKRLLGYLLAATMLLSMVACGNEPPAPTTTEPVPTTEPAISQIPGETDSEETEPSVPETTAPPQTEPVLTVTSLQEQMAQEGNDFAAAYLGYMTYDSETVWDFLDPQTGYLPVLNEIPDTNIVCNTPQGEVYCVLPATPETNIKVYQWNPASGDASPVYDDLIYEKTGGDPYILVCNASFYPDTMVVIDDDIVWYPQLDEYLFVDGDNLLDFSPYDQMLLDYYRTMLNDPDSNWVVPTEEDLVNSAWYNDNYDLDGNYYLWQMNLKEKTMDVRWNLAYGEEDSIYEDAEWHLTTKDGIAVLTVDFGEFAGQKSYNLLLDKEDGMMYIAVDATRGAIHNEWECQYRFLIEVTD